MVRNGTKSRTIDRGVPQGSVLEPLLWNIEYDTVVSGTVPEGVHVTCYVDDTLLVACSRGWTKAIRLMEAGLKAIIRKISGLGLEVATRKLEATWFHGLPANRSPPKAWIAVRGDRILVGPTIKYLGVVLDPRMNFEKHFSQTAPRVERAALSLGRILPNIVK